MSLWIRPCNHTYTSSERAVGARTHARMTPGDGEFDASVWCHRVQRFMCPLCHLQTPCRKGCSRSSDCVRQGIQGSLALWQMRHDTLAGTFLMPTFVSAYQLVAEPRFYGLSGQQGMLQCQCRCGIWALLARGALTAVELVVTHASAKSYDAQAAK